MISSIIKNADMVHEFNNTLSFNNFSSSYIYNRNRISNKIETIKKFYNLTGVDQSVLVDIQNLGNKISKEFDKLDSIERQEYLDVCNEKQNLYNSIISDQSDWHKLSGNKIQILKFEQFNRLSYIRVNSSSSIYFNKFNIKNSNRDYKFVVKKSTKNPFKITDLYFANLFHEDKNYIMINSIPVIQNEELVDLDFKDSKRIFKEMEKFKGYNSTEYDTFKNSILLCKGKSPLQDLFKNIEIIK